MLPNRRLLPESRQNSIDGSRIITLYMISGKRASCIFRKRVGSVQLNKVADNDIIFRKLKQTGLKHSCFGKRISFDERAGIMGNIREILEKAFEEYVSSFDSSDERISLKIKHTFCVAENSDEICSRIGLPKEDREVAYAIAVLHDIGRFEQASRRHSFLDSSESDHAEEGVKFLFGENQIASFLPLGSMNEDDLECIRLAIKYHNKHLLPDDLSSRQKVFCNIIRDADKLDIFRISLENSFEKVHEFSEEEVKNSKISDVVRECFAKWETLDYSKRQYPADFFLGHIAMCFGLCYPCSRSMAAEQGYIRKMMELSFHGKNEEEMYAEMKKQVEKFLSTGN